MTVESEFFKILRDKMGANPPEEVQPPPLSPPKLSFEKVIPFIEMDPITWSANRGKRAYPRRLRKNSPAHKTTKKTPPAEPFWSYGQLSTETQNGISEMKKLGARFDSEKISLGQLKKEFRRLAKIHHPDHGKTPMDGKIFQALLLNYRKTRTSLELLALSTP